MNWNPFQFHIFFVTDDDFELYNNTEREFNSIVLHTHTHTRSGSLHIYNATYWL